MHFVDDGTQLPSFAPTLNRPVISTKALEKKFGGHLFDRQREVVPPHRRGGGWRRRDGSRGRVAAYVGVGRHGCDGVGGGADFMWFHMTTVYHDSQRHAPQHMFL